MPVSPESEEEIRRESQFLRVTPRFHITIWCELVTRCNTQLFSLYCLDYIHTVAKTHCRTEKTTVLHLKTDGSELLPEVNFKFVYISTPKRYN